MKENFSAARQRAEQLFAKASEPAHDPAHAKDGGKEGGSPQYRAQVAATEAKNERLRGLRLARDAAEPRRSSKT